MAHLKCKTHNQRAMVIQTDNGKRLKVIHRNDGVGCTSPKLRIGKQEYEPWEVELRGASVDLTRKV